MVRKGGLEPPRVLPHQILNLYPNRTKSYENLSYYFNLPGFSPLLFERFLQHRYDFNRDDSGTTAPLTVRTIYTPTHLYKVQQ